QESKRRQGFHVRSSCGAMRESGFIVGRKEQSGRPCGRPEDQTYFWVPSIPSVAWQPYPSPLGRLRAHSFASPPHDGFAFIEDSGFGSDLLCNSLAPEAISVVTPLQ